MFLEFSQYKLGNTFFKIMKLRVLLSLKLLLHTGEFLFGLSTLSNIIKLKILFVWLLDRANLRNNKFGLKKNLLDSPFIEEGYITLRLIGPVGEIARNSWS